MRKPKGEEAKTVGGRRDIGNADVIMRNVNTAILHSI